MRWILTLGLSGFLAGFLGPMVLYPDANTGPLVGILITGPLGFLIGLIGMLIARVLRAGAKRQRTAITVLATILVTATLFSALPPPELKGVLYTGVVDDCRPVAATESAVMRKWQRRVAEASYATPTENWQAEMSQALRTDDGVTVHVHEARAVEVRRHRKPWNRGRLAAINRAGTPDTMSVFDAHREGSCADYANGTAVKTFYSWNDDMPTRPLPSWPPTQMDAIVGQVSVVPIPVAYRSVLGVK